MLNKSHKILLSLPALISLFYFVAVMFPNSFNWLFPSMKAYYSQIMIVQSLNIAQIVILLRRIWMFKALNRSKKVEWTWALIVFASIASLIYVWKRNDEYCLLSRETNR